ncbi:MAG: trehalose-6-phosphate synthase [Thermoanaerobaculia bacterium]
MSTTRTEPSPGAPSPAPSHSFRGEPTAPRIIVASHELPVALSPGTTRPASPVRSTCGGLVSGVHPVLEGRGGVWVGWPGGAHEGASPAPAHPGGPAGRTEAPYGLHAVDLTPDEIRDYDLGFANQVLWPVFHGLPDHSLIEAGYWPAYQEVNRKFAQEIASVHRNDDLVWVHDYHLLLVGRDLASFGVTRGVSFFLHTPFPPPELFFRIPWADEILAALADYDLVGFQTDRHVANFLACVRRLDPEPRLAAGQPVMSVSARIGGTTRRFRVGAFPIGVDYYEIAAAAGRDEVTARVRDLRRGLGRRRLLLGVDRLDYTKGVRHKLKAFAALLERHPEWQGEVVLHQIVIPSREGIPAYDQLKLEIEGLVGEINGRFSRPGWVPVQYRYRSLDREELLVHYRLADVAVVTPLEDGMNLVAKEFCAADVDERGVLLLSRFAGAAAQLSDGAILVNPWDEVGLAEVFHRALTLGPEERRQRMERLRATVRNEDVFRWAGSYLKAALAGAPREHAEAVLAH